jgi:transcription initiation factor TFIIIB Brf1 subunit/transcription initiation factor TFIIB
MQRELVLNAERFKYKLTEQLIKKRVTHMQAHNYLRSSKNRLIYATLALKLKMTQRNKKPLHESITEYLDQGCSQLSLPEKVRRRASEIADSVGQSHLLAGRDPKVISATIVTIACEKCHISITKSKIIRQFHTNSDAVNQVSKIVLKILSDKYAME